MMARPRPRRLPAPATFTALFYITSAVLAIAFVFSLSGHLPDRDSFTRGASPLWPQRTQSSYLPLTDSDHSEARVKGLHRLPQVEGGVVAKERVWRSQYSRFYGACSDPSSRYSPVDPTSDSNGFLVIETSGGLNQQRIGITDAVVVARILNATLVIPRLDHDSFWKDDSDFGDLFDEDWFVRNVAREVRVVNRAPADVPAFSMRVPRKSKPSFYLDKVLPVLRERRVIRLTKFDFRLANSLDTDLQKLRCRVNYKALQFTRSISTLGQCLVDRMKQKSGTYIALHLRFEPDMLAFSGCYYGGGDAEVRELGEIRKRWANLHVKNPEQQRRNGKCPLSPLEVGLMLKALGFDSDSHLYVASGEVYGGERTLAPLKAMFPNLETKDTLASKQELQAFGDHTSQLAAIDYIVCDRSDVFVTNNNGNMAKVLAGRRRFFGHKRTIRPNARKLGQLFLDRHAMSWELFAKKLQSAQQGFMGEPMELRPGKGGFHEYPAACICEAFPGAQEQMEALKLATSAKDRYHLQQQLEAADLQALDNEGSPQDAMDQEQMYYTDMVDPETVNLRSKSKETQMEQIHSIDNQEDA